VIILDIIKYGINNGISLKDIIKLNFGITINEFFKFISNDKSLIVDIISIGKEKIILDYIEEEILDYNEEEIHMRHILKTKMVDIDISKRALSCLKNADIKTFGELVQYNRKDLLKIRNFGKKSLSELDELLSVMNLNFE
jgi:DNA-directed RNA polymerase subunit alpha